MNVQICSLKRSFRKPETVFIGIELIIDGTCDRIREWMKVGSGNGNIK